VAFLPSSQEICAAAPDESERAALAGEGAGLATGPRKTFQPPRRNPLGGFSVRAVLEQTVALHPPVKVPITCTEPTHAGAARN